MNIFQVVQAWLARFPRIAETLRKLGGGYQKGAKLSGGLNLTRTTEQHLRGIPHEDQAQPPTEPESIRREWSRHDPW